MTQTFQARADLEADPSTGINPASLILLTRRYDPAAEVGSFLNKISGTDRQGISTQVTQHLDTDIQVQMPRSVIVVQASETRGTKTGHSLTGFKTTLSLATTIVALLAEKIATEVSSVRKAGLVTAGQYLIVMEIQSTEIGTM